MVQCKTLRAIHNVTDSNLMPIRCGLRRSGGSQCFDAERSACSQFDEKMALKCKNFCNFTTKMDEKLIELVSTNEVLYNTAHKLYKDLNVRDNVWLAISTLVGKSVQDCKTRWRSLRDLYHRKRKQEKTGKQSRIHWEYMESLSFLENFTYVRRSEGPTPPATDITIIKEENFDEEPCNFNNYMNFLAVPVSESDLANAENISEPPTKKIKIVGNVKEEDFQEESEAIQLLRDIRDATQSTQHPVKMFFDSMGQTVMGFPPKMAAEVKLKVCQIVTEMECRLLESNNPLSDNDIDF